MKLKVICISIFFMSKIYSQVEFEKGYFIDNANNYTSCFIKNNEWKNNPKAFSYKRDSLAEILNISIEDIKEWGITSMLKYIKAEVMLDISSEDYMKLSHDKLPIWQKDTVFLKVLVEGKSCLYYYENKGLRRFFYSNDTSPIQPLVYKHYLLADQKIHTNNTYSAQLKIDLNCHNGSLNQQTVGFNKKDLKKYFLNYNSCMGSKSIDYDGNYTHKNLINIKLLASLNYSNLEYQYFNINYIGTKFNNLLNYSIGLELENFFPFNKKRWSLFVSPVFHYYNTSKESYNNGDTFQNSVNYKAYEVSMGLKYNYNINKSSRIYISPAFLYDFVSNSKIENDFSIIEIEAHYNYYLSVGYEYNKYSISLRKYGSVDLISSFRDDYSSSFNNISLVFGYKIFNY